LAHTDDKRAEVFADLLLGKSNIATAKAHDVTLHYVKAVRATLPAMMRERNFGELLGGLLEKQIGTEVAILEAITEPNWLAQQSADALGHLYGTVADRRMELTIAAHRAGALGSTVGRDGSGPAETGDAGALARPVQQGESEVGLPVVDAVLVDE